MIATVDRSRPMTHRNLVLQFHPHQQTDRQTQNVEVLEIVAIHIDATVTVQSILDQITSRIDKVEKLPGVDLHVSPLEYGQEGARPGIVPSGTP